MGQSIKEQNEWARPGLSPSARKKRSISFTDLEEAAESEILRPDYLEGNNSVHAGAYAAINHLDLGGPGINMVKPRDHLDDESFPDIGMRTARYVEWATLFVGKAISTETEEYDELLVVFEVCRVAEEVKKSFTDGS
jgi:hypothetical protein